MDYIKLKDEKGREVYTCGNICAEELKKSYGLKLKDEKGEKVEDILN